MLDANRAKREQAGGDETRLCIAKIFLNDLWYPFSISVLEQAAWEGPVSSCLCHWALPFLCTFLPWLPLWKWAVWSQALSRVPGRARLPRSLSSELGARPRPVTKDTGHPISCVSRNSSPCTWLTALFTVYKLLTWGPLWTSWNSIWHSMLPVWEVWVPSCSSKGWDPKNIGKK